MVWIWQPQVWTTPQSYLHQLELVPQLVLVLALLWVLVSLSIIFYRAYKSYNKHKNEG
jgi:hypothetical protein